MTTEGEADGKISWKDLTVTADVVKGDKKGNVSLPADPRASDGKLPHVTITAPCPTDRAGATALMAATALAGTTAGAEA